MSFLFTDKKQAIYVWEMIVIFQIAASSQIAGQIVQGWRTVIKLNKVTS